ncbi:MAG: NAD kinase [Cytophagales bacterium]|nr:NAD kinase [Cytophagales bacterium]
MRVAVHGKPFKEEVTPSVQAFFDQLAKDHCEISLSESFENILQKKGIQLPGFSTFVDSDSLSIQDFFFSIGGDGTFLESVTFVAEKEIPIVGVNTGRLGFLATVPATDITKSYASLVAKKFSVERRMLLSLETDKSLFDNCFALNEFAIQKKDSSSMIVVHTYINGTFLNSYWADGLIVSTPTGSTGYSLSCGGPVVLPEANNFIISPVCPHNLNVRPLVVPDNSVLSFEIEGRSKNFLVSLDSRSRTVNPSIKLSVRKADFNANIVSFVGQDFLDTLRHKLNWGLDVRN